MGELTPTYPRGPSSSPWTLLGPLLVSFWDYFRIILGFLLKRFGRVFGDVSESWFEVFFLRIFWDSFGSRSSCKRVSRSIAKTGFGFSAFSVFFRLRFWRPFFLRFFSPVSTHWIHNFSRDLVNPFVCLSANFHGPRVNDLFHLTGLRRANDGGGNEVMLFAPCNC